MNHSVLTYAIGGTAAMLLLVQAVRPDRTNPPVTAPIAFGDERIERIIRRSCFDCHSNETQWPWYSEVAPVSWVIASHVREGREQLNFSAWTNDGEAFEEICERVRAGAMPMPGYAAIHRGAALAPADRDAICAWCVTREGL